LQSRREFQLDVVKNGNVYSSLKQIFQMPLLPSSFVLVSRYCSHENLPAVQLLDKDKYKVVPVFN
jgi:hypothetical protein